jgi:hypothetical protein
MANKRVKIYERVQVHRGRWTDRAATIPKLRSDGTLYLKDEREGKFRVSWYEGTKKQWHPTTCRTLGEALKVKDDKEWFLKNQNRPGVQDATLPDVRLPVSAAVDLYVDSLTRCKRTKSAYGHAVREFEAWNSSLKNGGKKTFVEEIDKAHLAKFFDYLIDDEPENCPRFMPQSNRSFSHTRSTACSGLSILNWIADRFDFGTLLHGAIIPVNQRRQQIPFQSTIPRQLGPKGRSDLRTSPPHPNHATRVAPACNRLWAAGDYFCHLVLHFLAVPRSGSLYLPPESARRGKMKPTHECRKP